MKKYSTLILPAFVLLTLGGCATSSGLVTSTENDGVYYSSKDQTTLTASAQQALAYNTAVSQQNGQQPIAGDDNPEYNDANGATTGSTSSAEYYDDNYSYAANMRRFNQGAAYGTGYYGMAYTDPFYYGGYSPYGMGYSPFGMGYGSPFGMGYGSSLSIGLGFGMRSMYSPYGYGYNPYGFGSSYYDPYYGGMGYGGLGYGGYGLGGYGLGGLGYGGYGLGGYGYGSGLGYGYGNGTIDRYSNNVRSAPRHDRSAEAISSSRQPVIPGGRMGSGVISAPNGSGNAVLNGGNTATNNGAMYNRSRGRIIDGNQPAAKQQQNALGIPADQPNVSSNGRGSRWRMFDQNNAQQSQAPATAPSGRSRGRMYNPGQQMQQQQASRPSRSSEQQPSRSFEQPSRSFSTPSSSPSFSAPSGGGGGGGSRGRVR